VELNGVVRIEKRIRNIAERCGVQTALYFWTFHIHFLREGEKGASKLAVEVAGLYLGERIPLVGQP
jgi:hypothetical protein